MGKTNTVAAKEIPIKPVDVEDQVKHGNRIDVGENTSVQERADEIDININADEDTLKNSLVVQTPGVEKGKLFDYTSQTSEERQLCEQTAAKLNQQLKHYRGLPLKFGIDLIAVQQIIGYGKFQAWVETKMPDITIRTAQLWMSAARYQWKHKSENFSLLPNSAIFKMAAKSTPEAACLEIFQLTRQGIEVSVSKVTNIIQKHSGPSGTEVPKQAKKELGQSKKLKAFLDEHIDADHAQVLLDILESVSMDMMKDALEKIVNAKLIESVVAANPGLSHLDASTAH